MRRVRDQKGFSLVELISVIAVVAVLTAAAAYGISIFFYKFKVLTYYADLQQDAMDALMQIKNGYPVSPNSDAILMGVASSTALAFPAGVNDNSTSHDLTCTASSVSEGGNHANDFIRFFWDEYGGKIKVRYRYGLISPSNPVTIFPTNHVDEIRVTDLSFSFLPGSNKNVVKVVLEAEVTVTTKEVRKVRYSTYMRISWI